MNQKTEDTVITMMGKMNDVKRYKQKIYLT